MRTAYAYIFCALLYSGFVVAACGSDPAVDASTASHTEGQALLDLKHARNAGAINHDEYEDGKQAIMDRYDD